MGDAVKPRKPCTRDAPLGARTPLGSMSRLRSSGPTKARRIRRAGVSEARGRQIVYARSCGTCEVSIPGVCLGRATNWHHRINRSQGGTWSASNGLHVCGSGTTGCHGVLTNTNGQRLRYERWGFICRSGAITTEVPVLFRCRRWVLLDDAGGVTDVEVAA